MDMTLPSAPVVQRARGALAMTRVHGQINKLDLCHKDNSRSRRNSRPRKNWNPASTCYSTSTPETAQRIVKGRDASWAACPPLLGRDLLTAISWALRKPVSSVMRLVCSSHSRAVRALQRFLRRQPSSMPADLVLYLFV